MNTPLADLAEKMLAAGVAHDLVVVAIRAAEVAAGPRTNTRAVALVEARAVRGTRLPSNWQPSESCVAYAIGRGMVRDRVVIEAERFRNYWITKSGRDAVKLDWPATWRNWIARALENYHDGVRNFGGQVECIPMPDLRRRVAMPSLPAWVASRVASLRDARQPDPVTGKHRMVPTIAPNLTLTAMERAEIERHAAELEHLCGTCPENDEKSEESTLLVVGKMMLALPSTVPNESSAEARAEAFLVALDDVPSWAVESAARRWYRGEAGKNDAGQPYDCHWCPSPADLRSITRVELWRVMGRAKALRRLLAAERLIEYPDEHCAEMRARLSAAVGIPLVGDNGSGGTSGES